MSLTVDRRRDLLIDLASAVHENLDELARLNVNDYAVPISFAGNAILLERFLRHFAGYVDKPHGTSTPVGDVANFGTPTAGNGLVVVAGGGHVIAFGN